MRSMTAMLPTASTGGSGTAEPSRTAVENASPCTLVRVGRRHLDDLEVGRDRRVAARRQDDARRTVGRDVERDLDQQPTGRADEVDALVVLDLRRARERRLAAAEVEHGRREDVGAEARIAQHGRDHAVRFAVEHPAGDVDRVAADVHQRAAAEVRRCCGCCRDRRCGRRRTPGSSSSSPTAPPSTSARTWRHSGWRRYMNASISATPALLARGDHLLGLGRGHRQRLLAQHVLAGGGGAPRPLGVEVVGQRDVHRFDVGVGEQLVVRAVGARDPELGAPRRPPDRGPARRWRPRRNAPTAASPGSPCGWRSTRTRAPPSAPARSRRAHVASRSVA